MCADTPDTTVPDYRDTVFLPDTDFPMRGGLPQREPGWLERWQRIGVYDRLRQKPGRAPFVLHQFRGRRRLLDDGATGREIAAQNRHAAFLENRS